MFNGFESIRTDAETIGQAHGVANQADIAQIGQKAPSDLVVGMAHIVACQWFLPVNSQTRAIIRTPQYK